MANKSIYVTMPTLAPLEEVTQLMQGIWERGIMTHNGPLVQRFEKEVADYIVQKLQEYGRSCSRVRTSSNRELGIYRIELL